MKVLYLNGVDRSRDEATTRQLVDAEPSLDLTTAASPPDAFARIRESGDIDALVTSPAVARSETLALIVSLRRDKVPVVIVPVVTESQNEFATAAIAAGADDVLLQLGGTLLNAPETLSRVMKVQAGPERDSKRLRVLYAGHDDLVWSLLDQLPFIAAVRAIQEPGSDRPVRHPDEAIEGLDADVVVIDAQADPRTQAEAVQAVRDLAPGTPLIVLTPPSMSDEDASALALQDAERISKTGLYRRPLVTALERRNAKRQGAIEEPSNDAAEEQPEVPAAVLETETETEAEPEPEADAPETLELPAPMHDEVDDGLPPVIHGTRDAAATDAAVAAAAEALEAARQDWDREREDLEARLASSATEAATARAELDQTIERQRSEHEAAADALRAEGQAAADALRAERDELATIRERLDEALEATRAELRDARSEQDTERRERTQTIERLEGELRSLEEARQAERARWEESAGSLETRLRSAATAAARAEFEATLEAARTELRLAEQRHGQERQSWEAARAELSERIRQLESGGAQRTELQRELDEAGDALRKARQATYAARKDLEETTTALTELRADRDRLQAALDDAQGGRQQIEAELDALRAERDRLQAERDAASAERDTGIKERDELRAMRKAATRDADTARAERDAARIEIDAVVLDRDAARRELEAATRERDAARSELERARAEQAGGQADLEGLRAERDAAAGERDAARAERDTAAGERDAARAERDTAAGERDAAIAARDAAIGERDAATVAADEARAAAAAARTATASNHEEVEAARAERDAAIAERDQARIDTGAARGEIEDLRAAVAAAQAERDAARTAADDARTEIDGVRTERDALRAERDGLQAERDQARRALEDQRAERETAWNEADAARTERDGLRAELERVRRELEDARETTAREAAARAAWQTERRDIESALDTTRGELDAEREASEAARADLERVRQELQQALDESRAAHEAAEARGRDAATAHERALAGVRQEAEAARRDLAAARTHLDETARWHEAQRASWDAARTELETRLAAVAAELESTRADLTARLAAADDRAQQLSTQLAGQPAAIAAARAEATESHRRFVRRAMFGHALMTPTGHLVDCNDALARLFGHRNAEQLLREYADRPFAPLAGRDTLDARLMSNGHAHGVESCLERADGQLIRVQESAARINDPARGDLIERVLIDMNEYAQLEDRLHRARRVERVGALAVEMAPDIEATLLAALDAVRRATASATDTTRRDLDAAGAATERVAGLIRQLLAFSRRQQREIESLDLSALVGRSEDVLRRLLGGDVALVVRVGDPQTVTAADDDVAQLLTALTVQARDLLPLGGTVRISTGLAPARTGETGLHARHVVLQVTATGYGVGTPQVTETLDVMADRCGGSISARHEAGREAGFEVAFSRCVPAGKGAGR